MPLLSAPLGPFFALASDGTHVFVLHIVARIRVTLCRLLLRFVGPNAAVIQALALLRHLLQGGGNVGL